MRLGHGAIQLTGDPALGLRMGQLSRLSQAGLAGVTAAQAPTVREAARCLIRFEALYGSNYRGQSSFHEDAQGAWLRFYSISPYNAYNRFVVDSIIAGWLQQLSSVSPAPLRAERIEIEFEDAGLPRGLRRAGRLPDPVWRRAQSTAPEPGQPRPAQPRALPEHLAALAATV